LLPKTTGKFTNARANSPAQGTAERIATRGPSKSRADKAATCNISHRAGEASKLAKFTT
jgi:hypothetical protein